ncbi:DNA mismatch repair protein MutS [Candidatus Margulisiibacteriota bacterium]
MIKQSPMVRQYLEIKDKHKDAILFFRLGDFYEMFNDDAKLASKELELTLTGRGKKDDENRMPMCGIPYHAAENYIARLVGRGYKIAICEQVEDPAIAKGITKREVVRVITPGTVTDAKMLPQKANNYLASIAVLETKDKETKYGLAFADPSTGEFKLTEIGNESDLFSELSRIQPAEILLADEYQKIQSLEIPYSIRSFQAKDRAEKLLKEHFKVSSLEGFGCNGFGPALIAAQAIIDYLNETQKTNITHVKDLQAYYPADFMYLDRATRRNLELTETMREKTLQGSLLGVLDRTKTAMGSRLLKQWLTQPLLDMKTIKNRLAAVAELFEDIICREELSQFLQQIYDLERIIGRVALGSVSPRDLISLKESLSILPEISSSLSVKNSDLLNTIDNDLLSITNQIVELINKAIVENPPLKIREGNIINEGYDAALDELKKLSKGGKAWVAALEKEERSSSGIKSLKVGYNKVFGYYIEITKSNLAEVPGHYIRKQTLTNAERFITPELKDKEAQILSSNEQAEKKEYEIFTKVREQINSYTPTIQKLAELLAQIDTLLAMAIVSVANNFKCPEILPMEKGTLEIVNGRHPVIEQTTAVNNFISNDCHMNEAEHRFMLLTGPNMSGKSTYIRQIALIILLAQIGCFVPADKAKLSLVSRIFTRVGASDDLASGHSTFMVEMTETANILNQADKHSLLILDEIGRGTSTYDGMSIAWAVAEYIHIKIGAKTLFATHYHEMTGMEKKYNGVKNFNVAVKEEGDHVVFLHKVLPGSADRSYGIHVAKMAGLPDQVIKRANEILTGLEKNSELRDKSSQLAMF